MVRSKSPSWARCVKAPTSAVRTEAWMPCACSPRAITWAALTQSDQPETARIS
jgi:hypothetical protein